MQQSLIGGHDFHDHSSSVKAIARASAHLGVGDLNMQLPPLSSIFSNCTTRAARSGEGPATDHRLPRHQACPRPSLSSKNSPLLLKKKQKKMQEDEDDSDNEEEEGEEDMEEEEEKEGTGKIVSGDGCFSVVCCKHCGRKFASGRALGGHMRTHNHPKQHSPSSCNGLAGSSSSDYYDDDGEAEEGRKKKKHPPGFDDHFGKPMHRETDREVQANRKTKLDYVDSDDAMPEIDREVEESQKSKLLGYAGDFDNVTMCEINGGIEKGKKKKLGGAHGKLSNSAMEIYGEVEEGRKKFEYRKFNDCVQEIDGEIEDGQIKLGYGCLVNSVRGVDGKVKEGRKKLDYGDFRNAVRDIDGSEIEGGCEKKLSYGSIGNSPWRTDREAKEGKKKKLRYGHPRRSSAQEIGRKLAKGGKYSRKASYGKFRSLTQNNIDNYTLPQPPPCEKAGESPFVGVKQEEEEEEGGSLSIAQKGINGREPISAKEGGGGGRREEEEEEEEEESDEGKASGHGLYMLRQNPKRSRRFDDGESDDCAGALAFLPPRVEKSAEISAENMNNSSLAASSSSSSSICREAGPAMACTVCSREFLSWRALCGHMRCHPDREWRGIHPPLIPNQRKLVRRCRKINPANSGKLANRNGHSSTSTEVVMEEFHHGHVKEGGGEGGRGFGKLVSDSESDSRYESPSKGARHDWHQLHRFGHGVTGKRSKRTWHSVKYLTNVEKEEGPLKPLHSSLPEQLGIEEEAEEEEEDEEDEVNREEDENDDNNEEDDEEEEIAMAIAMGNGLVMLACAARRSEEKESSPALISHSNMVAKDERLESAREMERERARRLDNQRQIYGGCDEESYYNGDESSSVVARREELRERNQNSQNIGRPGIPMSKYDCGTCKRSFNSHQALGGHRASHRHIKGCFAKTTEDEDKDEDAEDEEQEKEEEVAADGEEREEGVEEREEEEGKVVRVKTIIQPLTPKDKEKEKLEKGNSNTSSNPNPYPNLNPNSNSTLKSSHSHSPSFNPNPNPNPNVSTSYTRGSGGQLTAKAYSKIHECSICHRVFASGQALGGHKRCHWNGDTKLLSAPKSSTKAAAGLSALLDLNLPAPVEDSNPMHGAYVVSNQHNRLDVATKDEPCSSTSNIPQLAFSLFHHPSQGSLIKSRVV